MKTLETAIVTALLTIALAFGIAALVGDATEEDTQRVVHQIEQQASVTRLLVCDVIVSLDLRVSQESKDTCRALLQEGRR